MGAYENQSVSQLQFSQTNYSVGEDDASITLTVTRKGSSERSKPSTGIYENRD
ncbi:MAG: hypothetical protein ABFS56_15755 [Pseudomonadota bacterium]